MAHVREHHLAFEIHAILSQWTLSSNLGFALGMGHTDDVLTLTLTPNFAPSSGLDTSIYFGYAGFCGAGEDQNFLEGGGWPIR